MALIFRDLLRMGIIDAPKNAVNIRISIPSKYLSEPYELPNDALIFGEILDVYDWLGNPVKDVDELVGSEITFILRRFFNTDYLYLSRNSWLILRDYGILPNEYQIKVKITSAKFDEEEIKIYPKVDKEIS